MDTFIKTIMEKHAGWIGNMVKRYKAVNNSPLFKTQKALGKVTLAALPTAYGVRQLTKHPEMNQVKNTVEGIPPSYQ